MIIAPIGFARTGKDEFAKVLVEEYGFKRFAFADKLRECLYALNPWIIQNEGGGFRSLAEVIDKFTWDGYKSSPWSNNIRELLQRFGTEVGRNLIAEDIWLRELDKVSGNIVITDARFPNELDKVVAKGGKLVHIHRPGYGPINDHISEVAHLEYVNEATYTLVNGDSIERYQENIRAVIGALGVLQ